MSSSTGHSDFLSSCPLAASYSGQSIHRLSAELFEERNLNMENTTNSFTKKIRNTTYIVSLKQSETAKKTLDEKNR